MRTKGKNEDMLEHFREKRKATTGIAVPADPHTSTSKKGIFSRKDKPHMNERDDLILTLEQTNNSLHFPNSESPPLSPTWG